MLDFIPFLADLVHEAMYGHMPAYAFMDVVCYDFNRDGYDHFECPCMDVRGIMAEVADLDVF